MLLPPLRRAAAAAAAAARLRCCVATRRRRCWSASAASASDGGDDGSGGRDAPAYIGVETEFIDTLQLSGGGAPLPTYQVLTLDGEVRRARDYTPALPLADLVRIYEGMRTLRVVDTVFHDVQRHGRISFYMSSTGEEALQFASAAALHRDDVVFAQYREPGVLMFRGFTIEQMAAQCFGNQHDLGKGRQMPVHYGSAALRFHTISSPLSTQMPQASGAAYALKRSGAANIAVCYFGDGAASEGDFHAALNFASARQCPALFFCRNNGYAISTRSEEQSAGDGIAPRGAGYGMAAVRVDGNDMLAVLDATLAARQHALRAPVLLEAMTYRGAHHSTSDDSTRYREQHEMRRWADANCPLRRARAFLQRAGAWCDDRESELVERVRQRTVQAVVDAEREPLPPIRALFDDVYADVPPELRRQQRALHRHLQAYPRDYNLQRYAQAHAADADAAAE